MDVFTQDILSRSSVRNWLPRSDLFRRMTNLTWRMLIQVRRWKLSGSSVIVVYLSLAVYCRVILMLAWEALSWSG